MPIAADSNIARKRSSLSRSRERIESERCETTSGAITAGVSQGFERQKLASATPSDATTRSIAIVFGEKRPLSR